MVRMEHGLLGGGYNYLGPGAGRTAGLMQLHGLMDMNVLSGQGNILPAQGADLPQPKSCKQTDQDTEIGSVLNSRTGIDTGDSVPSG